MRTPPAGARVSFTSTNWRRRTPRTGSRGCPTGAPSTWAADPAHRRSTTGPTTRPCESCTSTPSDASMPDFFDVVHRQRACRNFASDDVDDDLLGKLLHAATFAPSAENKQPWVFVVVREETTRTRIAELTRQVWDGGARA